MDRKPDLDLIVDDLMPRSRSLRIATVTETWPPEVNGVALTVSRMVQGLRDRGHRIQLVRVRQGRSDQAGSDRDFSEILLSSLPIPRYTSLRMGLPCARELVRLWAVQRPDVVHIATEGPLGWSALRASERLRIPAVSEFRTNFQAYSGHYGLSWLRKPILGYLRKFHNRTLCTMVPTDALRGELDRLGFQRLEVVGRGVDTRRFSPAWRSESLRRAWQAGPDTLVMTCVSRLAAEKNLDLACEAYREVVARGIDARLVLVGDGPLRKTLEQSHPQVIFAGMQTGDRLAEHYASADLFVFPSLTETFGNVVAEAMASGLPVVGFDYAAAHTLVRDAGSGWLVRTGDCAHFVERVREAAIDADRLVSAGEAARRTALCHDWDQVVARLEKILIRAADARLGTVSPVSAPDLPGCHEAVANGDHDRANASGR
jgi:glycosyltransferase involved in cell wall biosynthesis